MTRTLQILLALLGLSGLLLLAGCPDDGGNLDDDDSGADDDDDVTPPVDDDDDDATDDDDGPGVEVEALAGLLNSSWGHLALELGARVNFGDGVLWLGLGDARERLWLPDVRGPTRAADRHALASAFADFPNDPVPPAHQLDSQPTWRAAIQRLDSVVGGLLGLDADAQAAVRQEWRALCARRLRLAASAR